MKILIIRFSSFGDVLQSLSVAGKLGMQFPNAEIHWVTREEFRPLIATHPAVRKVWSLKKGAGLLALMKLGRELKREKFTHVYDAHNNLRSHLLGAQLSGLFAWRRWSGKLKLLRRSIYRYRRFLLFRFRRNLFPQPFSGQFALLEPLKEWGINAEAPPVPQLYLDPARSAELAQKLPTKKFVALAPSAAFELKRWPLAHWQSLIDLFPNMDFVVLGGPEDTFLKELETAHPTRVFNWAGKLSLLESAHAIALSQALVSNDTGLMHVAEQIGKPCLALMGPAPFGFPSRPATTVFELNLPCRPCSKHGQGPCVNPEFQKCLMDIAPAKVAKRLAAVLDA